MFCCCFGPSNHGEYEQIGSATKRLVIGTAEGLQPYQLVEANGNVTLKIVGDFLPLSKKPSNLAVSKDGQLLLVSHLEGSLTTVNLTPFKQLQISDTKGVGTCNVAIGNQKKFVFATNYDSGSGVIFKVLKNRLELFNLLQLEDPSHVVKDRQDASHPYCFTLDPHGQFAYLTDLGGDTLIQYRFDSERGPMPDSAKFIPLRPGSGPRQIAFNPDGHSLYVSCELSNEIAVITTTDSASDQLTTSSQGANITNDHFRVKQIVSTLGRVEPTNEHSTTDVHISPNGSHLYASVLSDSYQLNRPDQIVIYRVNLGGTLQLLAHISTRGKNPSSFDIDPTGEYLLVVNRDSHNLVPFRIKADGTLELCGDIMAVNSPIVVAFLPQ